MSATVEGFKAILLAEIRAAGDEKTRATTDAILAVVFDTIWESYSDQGRQNPRLQYLYAKCQVIEYWKSETWRDTDYDDDVKESLGQMSRALDLMHKLALQQIEALELALRHVNGPAVGQLTTTSTHAPLTGQADPSHPAYRGDPRYRGSLIR